MPMYYFANFRRKLLPHFNLCSLTLAFYKMQFQVCIITFMCYQLIFIIEFAPKMKHLFWLNFWFNRISFSGFKVSVTNDLLCDILLSLIPFWSDYLSSWWMLFSDKQNYNQVNWNYMAKSRCQRNILCIFGELIIYIFIFYLHYNISFFLLLFSGY